MLVMQSTFLNQSMHSDISAIWAKPITHTMSCTLILPSKIRPPLNLKLQRDWDFRLALSCLSDHFHECVFVSFLFCSFWC